MKIINQDSRVRGNYGSVSMASNTIKPQVQPKVTKELNLNSLNYANKSLVSFKGLEYYRTLQTNYFNLPKNKETGKPFPPDIYQKAAAENLYKGNDVIVTAPTGTGKTAIAHYIINKNMEDGMRTFYTTPLKALSNDKIREFKKIYGEENVGLITGDKKINKDAPIVIMTTEVYRNMVINDRMKEQNPMLDNLKTVIFDELHYLGDTDRGGVWEQAIMFTDPDVQILSLSGTMANPEKVTDWMASIKGHKNTEKVTPKDGYRANDKGVHTVLINVPSQNRHVPLEFSVEMVDGPKAKVSKRTGSKKEREKARKQAKALAQSDSAAPAKHSYAEMVDKLQEQDKLPAIFFVFSKREGKNVLNYLSYGNKLTSEEESEKIDQTVNDFKAKGKHLGESLNMEALKKGYALHNAGMLPDQKELIEELFQKKLLKVVISTETLSAGINMPARSTVISALRKPTDNPDGSDHRRYITPNEFHQMAGRAGRRGIDTTGYCFLMATNKSQKTKFENLVKTPSNDIESHFNIDYSFVATANDAYRDQTQSKLEGIFNKSFFAYDEDSKKKNQIARDMAADFKRKENTLKDYGYIGKDNELTLKGILLSELNGYEQIPVIDSVANGDLFGLTPVQLAGFAAGLANMESTPKTDLPTKTEAVDFADEKITKLVYDMDSNIYEYNLDIYSPQNRELKQNKQAIDHVYSWATLNSESKDYTNNWKELYSGESSRSIRDEGTLFREITMTTDLLKQLDEIAKTGSNYADTEKERNKYQKLSETIQESIQLINQPPAKNSGEEEME